jgi:YHS domain-containing protein
MRIHGSLRIGVLRLGLAALAFLLLPGCGLLQPLPESADADLMLGGHDPVAYFSAGRPVAGRPEIRAEHRGASYRFASEESRRQFITHPDRYVPRFDGLCANGMAYAMPAESDPASFKIIEGRLYLFANRRARLYFEMDQERNLRLANHYWQTEVGDANRTLQFLKRQVFRVPHYKTNAQLAEEYEKRFGKSPG